VTSAGIYFNCKVSNGNDISCIFWIRGALNVRLSPTDTAALNNPHKPRHENPEHKDQHLLLQFISRSRFMRHFVRFIVSAFAAICCNLDRGSVSLRVVTWIIPISWDTNPGLCTRRTEFVTVVLTDVSWRRGFQFLVSCVVEKKSFNCFLRGLMMAVICYRKMQAGKLSPANSSTQLLINPRYFFYFNTLYRASYIILYSDQ
jgi:hypothetical protein